MGQPLLPDTLPTIFADLERRLYALETTSRSTLGLPGPLIAPLASNFDFGTAATDITGVTVSVTVGQRRRLRIAFHANIFNNDFTHPGGNNTVRFKIMEGATELARRTRAGIADSADTTGLKSADIDGEIFVTPTAGIHAYKLTAQITNGPSQNMTITGGGTDPAFISVEDVGMIAA